MFIHQMSCKRNPLTLCDLTYLLKKGFFKQLLCMIKVVIPHITVILVCGIPYKMWKLFNQAVSIPFPERVLTLIRPIIQCPLRFSHFRKLLQWLMSWFIAKNRRN